MAITETITYQYDQLSALTNNGEREALFLSKYSEVRRDDAPCFFWGRLTDPYVTARCLLTLSNVVQSSFSLSPFERSLLKDPIVTAGQEKIRFEGFSHCAGVYARVDVLGEGIDGEFLASGTTNVDFNQPMLTALSSVRKNEQVLLSIGQKAVGLHREAGQVIERKVPLPSKWIKGLTSVQLFLADSEHVMTFNRMEALLLFKSIPTGKPKTDYYLLNRGGKPSFSPVKAGGAITVGGVHRLKLIEPLLAITDRLQVFAHPDMQSTTWQVYIGPLRFSLSLSRDAWRGFSGEGAALESLIEDVPESWIESMERYSDANQAFNPTLLALEEDLSPKRLSHITGRLSAIGLLGFDLDDNQFFYRRLPFKMSRILSLNPRMKDAEKLLTEGKVHIRQRSAERVEADVAGTDVHHLVLLEGDQERCTCTWFSKNQGERGPCKHILAVKKLMSNL